MSYPDYTYDGTGNQSDPVNLIYKKVGVDEVINFLGQDNWKNAIGNNQFLNLSTGRQVNDAQLENGSFFTTRFHMRLWNVAGDCIGSAHYETYQLIRHEVHHFEGAEKKVADAFCGLPGWHFDDIKGLNAVKYEKYNDGKATLISKSGTP